MTDSQFNTMVRLLQDTNTTLNARMDKIDNELADVKADIADLKAQMKKVELLIAKNTKIW